MEAGTGPYLVIRREDGYGDVIALAVGQRCTLGRANTNRVVLKDELCSREHAEVYFAEGRWRLRDLKSLNGTRVNGDPIQDEWELVSGDEFSTGRTRFVFVNQLDELPSVPLAAPGETVSIKKRLSQSRFMTPNPEAIVSTVPVPDHGQTHHAHRSISRDLAQLYRLGLEMGAATTYEELAEVVLDGLLEAVHAEVGAFLTVKEARELEVTAVRPVAAERRTYSPVSEFVTNEVMSSSEAILAEDVSRNRYLSQRDSMTQLGATSLICAPVVHQRQGAGADPPVLHRPAPLARHRGPGIHRRRRQAPRHRHDADAAAGFADGREPLAAASSSRSRASWSATAPPLPASTSRSAGWRRRTPRC